MTSSMFLDRSSSRYFLGVGIPWKEDETLREQLETVVLESKNH